MKIVLYLTSFILAGCAGVPKQKAPINPVFYTQDVNPLFMKPATDFYQEMHRECRMKSPNASYKVAFFPLTKPLLYSNANGMVQENHIRPGQLEEVRASSLKVFAGGRRCFQKILSSSEYKDYGKYRDLESISDPDWDYKVVNGKTTSSLTELKPSELRKLGINPPDLVIYELVYCAKADLDFTQDVSITATLKANAKVSCQVAWLAK